MTDPSLKEFQVRFESQYWYKSRSGWIAAARFYEDAVLFFGADRKPRDIFRADVQEFKTWLEKKGRAKSSIGNYMTFGSRLFRLLNELELVEKDFNPFYGTAPKRIR